MSLNLSRLDSPLGPLLLVTGADQTIHALAFDDRGRSRTRALEARWGPLDGRAAPTGIANALARYFEGALAALDALPIALNGSEVEGRVWQALRRIPIGTTTTYGRLARSLGFEDPRAAIDVGAANAANPIAIIVPCHRVIGSDGSLKGYAWGQHRKRHLLEHEQALPVVGHRQRPQSQTLSQPQPQPQPQSLSLPFPPVV